MKDPPGRSAADSAGGGVAVWKPAGITSRAALNTLQRSLARRALGHTGTLDPLASGILVVLAGEARKFQRFLMSGSKTYR
ncbi:MAG: tRNA pseudouridine(55) synthase TruB, partial [Planctomycetes bacterium]|nr:tRNA pseudouridine(55) synthase TruB [Planctomycetota bacterium]